MLSLSDWSGQLTGFSLKLTNDKIYEKSIQVYTASQMP